MVIVSTDDDENLDSNIQKTIVPLNASDEAALFNVNIASATDVQYSTSSSDSEPDDDETERSADDTEASDSDSGTNDRATKSVPDMDTNLDTNYSATTPKRKRYPGKSGTLTPISSVNDSNFHTTPKRMKPESSKGISATPKRGSRETPKRILIDSSSNIIASPRSTNIIATPRSSVMISSPRVTPSDSAPNHGQTSGARIVINNVDLMKLEKAIADKIESTRKSLAYDIRRGFEGLTVLLTKRLDEAGIKPIVNPQRELDTDFPIDTLEKFIAFDDSLAEKPRENLMIHWMSTWCSRTNVGDAVASIMSRLLDKEVQLLFSGVGKREKHGGKKNFSATKSFNCMCLTIINRLDEGKCTTIDIQQCTTKWLAGAEDRKGGRKVREAAKKSRTPQTVSTDTNVEKNVQSPSTGAI